MYRNRLEKLHQTAREVNIYIKRVKECIDGNPIDLKHIPMFYIGKEWWDEDCIPSGTEMYYGLLLYYRKVLKKIEKEIKVEKQKAKDNQRKHKK